MDNDILRCPFCGSKLIRKVDNWGKRYYACPMYRFGRCRGYIYKENGYTLQLNQFFGVIKDDVCKLFFTLDTKNLNLLFSLYGQQYGSNAEKYARDKYPMWRNKNINISAQILLRLIELLPKVLSLNSKTILFEKLYKSMIFRFSEVEFTTNIDDLNYTVDRVKNYVINLEYKERRIPEEVKKIASWIVNDDIELEKKLFLQYEQQKLVLLKDSALIDLDRFYKHCQNIYQDENIYGDVDLKLILLSDVVNVHFIGRKKPWYKSIF